MVISSHLNLLTKGGCQAPPALGALTIPMDSTFFSKVEIEEIVAMIRLNLYNRDRTHGANAIFKKMESMGVHPLPSLSSIARILTALSLTHGRTGLYP